MTDMIDILDSDGFFIGQTATRTEVHQKGYYHRAIHVYLFNLAGKLLLQQRSSFVDHFPGCVGISVTGHVDSGEHSSMTVRREIKEELNIDSSNYEAEFFFSVKQEAKLSSNYIDRQFNDVFVCKCKLDLLDLCVNSQEVESTLLVTLDEFCSMVKKKDPRIPPVYEKELTMLLRLI